MSTSILLRYQELEPARLAAIERRARWKGLYPELRAGAAMDRGKEWNGGDDLTFSSGALHRLWDLDRSRDEGWDAAVTLTWELSDFVSPDDPLAGIFRAGGYAPFTAPFNATGQPAASVPLYHNAAGLPIGTQFVAAYGREDLLFRIAAQLETAQPFRHLATR